MGKINQLRYTSMLFILVATCGSCRKDFEYGLSTGNLQFSRDTVYLDTVFSTIGSSTYGFKVYNRGNKDIQVPIIKLAKGPNSGYRLNVDGVPGKEFRDLPILAKDSIYVFVEITFDVSAFGENEFLYTDAIEFDTGDNRQDVQLVTLVRDAVFLFPRRLSNGFKETLPIGVDGLGNEIRVEGFELNDGQLTFTGEKPYVIYGYAAVPEGKELVINAGARVHFHKDSGIFVMEKASLKINGELSADPKVLEKEVLFEGDRLEPGFDDVPGQWGGIWLSSGSADNQISYLSLKNATVGLLVEGAQILESPTLSIKNARIYNSSITNLWARSAMVRGENLVLGGAGNTSLYCNLGGDYRFLHCTIANYWRNGFRTGPAVRIDNYGNGANGSEAKDLIQANFVNCIIDGNRSQELFLDRTDSHQFNFNFMNSLIKFQVSGLLQTDPRYDFGNNSFYSTVFINQNPDFFDVRNNDFRIGENSAANGNADVGTAILVPFDILGDDRTVSPDIGAYQTVPKN